MFPSPIDTAIFFINPGYLMRGDIRMKGNTLTISLHRGGSGGHALSPPIIINKNRNDLLSGVIQQCVFVFFEIIHVFPIFREDGGNFGDTSH